jgi:hypothetical protein
MGIEPGDVVEVVEVVEHGSHADDRWSVDELLALVPLFRSGVR